MTLQLEYNGSAAVPLEVEGIVPDAISDRSVDEIDRLGLAGALQEVLDSELAGALKLPLDKRRAMAALAGRLDRSTQELMRELIAAAE